MARRGAVWLGKARHGKDEKMEITSKINNQKMKGGYTR